MVNPTLQFTRHNFTASKGAPERVHVLPDWDVCLHGVQPAHWMTKGELLHVKSVSLYTLQFPDLW